MKTPFRTVSLIICFFTLLPAGLTGCGKKGPPLPPEGLVPEAVTSIRAKGAEGSLYISWQMPQKNSDGSKLLDLAGFKLYKKSGAWDCKECPAGDLPLYIDIDLEAPGAAMVKGRSVTFADPELTEGKQYSYKIAPYNKSGYLGKLSRIITVKWQSPSSPPGGFEGSASDKAATLRWQALADEMDGGGEDFLGYNLYRSETSGDYPPAPLTSAPLKGDSFTDIGLINNKQYFYAAKSVLKAGDAMIESHPSREIVLIPIDTIPPSPPAGLTVVLSGAGTKLFWETGTDADIGGYNIYRRAGGELAAEKINAAPVEGATLSDDDVKNGKSYYYSPTAVDNSPQRNESAPSKEVGIKIPKK